MAKAIYCECGEVIRADNEDDLVKKYREHLRSKHPKVKMTRKQILAMVA